MSSSLSPVPANVAVDDGPFTIMRDAEQEQRAESSTSYRKRRDGDRQRSQSQSRSVTPETRPFKRVREATPISTETADVPDASTAEALVVEGTSGQFLPDLDGDERGERERERERQQPHEAETSEKEEPSVLFSEQEGTRTEPTEAIDDGQLRDDDDDEEGEGESTTMGDVEIAEPEFVGAGTSDQMSPEAEDDDDEEEPESEPEDDIGHGDYDGLGRRHPQTTRELYDRHAAAGRTLTEYHSGDSDDYELDHRPVLDRAGIKRDIRAFMASMDDQALTEDGTPMYQVIDRLGEGTFSSVYLAYDRSHGKYYNRWWTYQDDKKSRNNFESHNHTVKVALKRVLATSSPQRIENELDILESLRGCRNVSQIITAFRQEDQVIIVMPFHMSDDFRHFYRHMDARHMRWYIGSLLRGLSDIHDRGIVHRDVKHANFLFHYESGEGVLCDFGLAERYAPPKKPTCQHAPATLESLAGYRTKTNDTPAVEQAVYDARKRSKLGEGRIGFPQEDKRPAIKTNRAGTRGFRAPEVLLKCPDQTVAIDVWSAGVMLLSILTHKFPVFNSNDDIEALMEIAAIFGRAAMEKCALLHNRTIMTNCPTVDQAPSSLTALILTLNPHLYTPHMASPTPEEAAQHIEAMDEAIDLCARLLRLDATKRITAKRALSHAFFTCAPGRESTHFHQPEVPILTGTDGKCGHLHQVVDGKHQAWFYKDCQDMQFGQGIPTRTDRLCPEHEHWQQRTLLNPISTSHHFTEPDLLDVVKHEDHAHDHDHAQDDLIISERPIFTAKNPNIDVDKMQPLDRRSVSTVKV